MLKSALSQIASDIDKILDEMIPAENHEWTSSPANVARYSTLNAGKRIRSFYVHNLLVYLMLIIGLLYVRLLVLK